MQIDLNADLGESFGRWTLGDDDATLDVVTSANVACGFHAGDSSVLRHSCEGAAQRGVAIGAQVGYSDLAGFGRRFIDIAPAELTDDVIYQIGALEGFARVAGTRVRYVKPHGALYNAIVHHEEQAAAVVDAVVQPMGIDISGTLGSGTRVYLEVGPNNANTAWFGDSDPGFDCEPPASPILASNEVRVTVCVKLDKTPVLDVGALSYFGFVFPGNCFRISTVSLIE